VIDPVKSGENRENSRRCAREATDFTAALTGFSKATAPRNQSDSLALSRATRNRNHARNGLPTVPAVNSEVGIGGEKDGIGENSVIRTRQASAKLIGTSEYFYISFRTSSASSPR
jgi:hypothetical protein